jgi:hypothetical protein
LNRIGATAANATLKRFVTGVGRRVAEEGPFAQLPPGCDDAFFTCSIDNADKMATSGLRRFGHELPDMHVTTVQLHCKKLIVVSESERLAAEPKAERSGRETHLPSKVVDWDRRAWTLSEGARQNKHGVNAGVGGAAGPVNAPSSIDFSRAALFQGPFTDLRAPGVTPESVLGLTAQEDEVVKGLSLKVFGAVLERDRTAKPGQERESLRDKLATSSETTTPEKSEIVYMATWPLKASSKEEFGETLLKVQGVLQVGVKMSRLVVAGDQQTWNFMVELKEEFPDEYGWILPIPGNWHLLFNLQPD